jgi:hypothetical protein
MTMLGRYSTISVEMLHWLENFSCHGMRGSELAFQRVFLLKAGLEHRK